jgi:hypothetical protein
MCVRVHVPPSPDFIKYKHFNKSSNILGVNLNLMPRGQVVTHCRVNLSLTSFYTHAGDPTIRLLLEVFASVNQRLYTVHLCTF